KLAGKLRAAKKSECSKIRATAESRRDFGIRATRSASSIIGRCGVRRTAAKASRCRRWERGTERLRRDSGMCESGRRFQNNEDGRERKKRDGGKECARRGAFVTKRTAQHRRNGSRVSEVHGCRRNGSARGGSRGCADAVREQRHSPERF